MSINPRSMLTISLQVVLSLLILFASTWAGLALYYQLPLDMPWRVVGILLWAGLCLFTLVRLWRRSIWQGLLIYLVLHGALLVWWNNLIPSNNHQWEEDVAQMTSGSIEGDQVTLFNVRNFDWHSETEYTPRWETREFA